MIKLKKLFLPILSTVMRVKTRMMMKKTNCLMNFSWTRRYCKKNPVKRQNNQAFHKFNKIFVKTRTTYIDNKDIIWSLITLMHKAKIKEKCPLIILQKKVNWRSVTQVFRKVTYLRLQAIQSLEFPKSQWRTKN